MTFLNANPTARQTSAGLLLIRVVLGTIFIAHGAQKVFTYGMGAIGGSFAEMGIPFGAVLGPVVSLVELVGGAALLAGLLTRVASLGLAATMLGAIMFAHLGAGFFAPAGYEYPLMLMAAAASLAMTGAGEWSADAVLERHLTGSAGDTGSFSGAARAAETPAVEVRRASAA